MYMYIYIHVHLLCSLWAAYVCMNVFIYINVCVCIHIHLTYSSWAAVSGREGERCERVPHKGKGDGEGEETHVHDATHPLMQAHPSTHRDAPMSVDMRDEIANALIAAGLQRERERERWEGGSERKRDAFSPRMRSY